MLALSEQPRGRVLLATGDIPAEYRTERRSWWTTNSPAWSAHIDADRNRGALLATVADMALAYARKAGLPLSVADFGCGEGAFLREFRKRAPEARLLGIDFCPAMLAQAKTRSEGLKIDYALCDLERRGSNVRPPVSLVTSILALDEMEGIDAAFGNIAAALGPGGICVVAVMDPQNERERNKEALDEWLNGNASSDKPVLIVKTFPTNGLAPVAPYSRIVRSLAEYEASAIAAGLVPGPVEQLSHEVGMGSYSGTLLFDILVFRKQEFLG